MKSNLEPSTQEVFAGFVERFGWTFAPGDKVMQIENDYDKEVYNGDKFCIDGLGPAV